MAYVFMHVFPELEAAQGRIGVKLRDVPFIEHHAYLFALIGLCVFYGLERVVRSAQQQHGGQPGGSGETTTGPGVFWLHVLSFGVYNALIGYLLVHREEQDLRGLLFFSVAMGVHFLVTDFGLEQDHKDTYRRTGRWVLGGAVVVGWASGLIVSVDRMITDLLFAFLAGAVVLNVLKEELPRERQSRFSAFLAGAAIYAALLLSS